MTTVYWYLTKGALGEYGNSKLRVFPQRPNEGPYIVDQDEGGSRILTDDNGNFLKSIERKGGKTLVGIDKFIEEELNKLNFERPSTRTYAGNKKKLSSRMMEPEDYEDRKKKAKKSKAKRKPVKKCKCK